MKEESIILTTVADVMKGGGGSNDPSAWEQLTLLLVIAHEKCDSAGGAKAPIFATEQRIKNALLTKKKQKTSCLLLH